MKPQKTRSDLDQQIDSNLKRAFEDMANAPIPDKFTELLDQLRTTGTATGKPHDK